MAVLQRNCIACSKNLEKYSFWIWNKNINLLLIWRLATLKLCSSVITLWSCSTVLCPSFCLGFWKALFCFFPFTSILSSIRAAKVLGLALLILTEQGLYLWNYFAHLTVFQKHVVLFIHFWFCRSTDLQSVQCIILQRSNMKKKALWSSWWLLLKHKAKCWLFLTPVWGNYWKEILFILWRFLFKKTNLLLMWKLNRKVSATLFWAMILFDMIK